MRTFPLAALAVLLVVPGGLPAQDRGLLVADQGWEVVKSEEAPPGTTLRFAADGSVTVTFKVDGKERAVSGTFALAGDQLTLKLSHDGRERVETRKVKKLTSDVLITEDKNRKLEELQRKK